MVMLSGLDTASPSDMDTHDSLRRSFLPPVSLNVLPLAAYAALNIRDYTSLGQHGDSTPSGKLKAKDASLLALVSPLGLCLVVLLRCPAGKTPRLYLLCKVNSVTLDYHAEHASCKTRRSQITASRKRLLSKRASPSFQQQGRPSEALLATFLSKGDTRLQLTLKLLSRIVCVRHLSFPPIRLVRRWVTRQIHSEH